MNYSLRKATLNDFAAIWALFLNVRTKMETEGNYSWSHKSYPLEEDFLEDIKKGEMYLYFVDDKLVGSCGIARDPASYFFEEKNKGKSTEILSKTDLNFNYPSLILERFMVDSSFQGKGIGSSFLKEIQRLEGTTNVIACVYKESEKTIAFYLRNGFKKHFLCSFADWGNAGENYYLCIKSAHE